MQESTLHLFSLLGGWLGALASAHMKHAERPLRSLRAPLQSKSKLRDFKDSGLRKGFSPVLSCWPSTLPLNSVP